MAIRNVSEADQQFIPKSDYDQLQQFYNEIVEQRTKLIDRVEQLEDALKKVNSGIHKASEMVEGLAHTNDKKVIEDLAFTIFNRHKPEKVTMKYRGETIIEIFEDK